MNRRIWTIGILTLVIAAAGLLHLHAEQPMPADRAPAVTEDGITVYFSPNGGCTEAVVAELGRAKKSIKVQAYSFTSAPIAKAILEAKKRGVEIIVVLDKSQRTEKYSSATFLKNSDVPVFIDDKHAIAHNKIILIDGATIITGSFNFTRAAEEKNAENLLIIHDKAELYGAYEKNFQAHLEHSTKYEGRPAAAGASARGPPATTQAAATQPTGKDGDVIVFVTKSGKKYHRENCPALHGAGIPVKLSDIAGDKQPCKRCKPPQ